MSSPLIYLDHAATTPLADEVHMAMKPFLSEQFGNPSSLHQLGRSARNAIDSARDQLAAVLHCQHREIVFTSGGTEANNLAIRGVVQRYAERGRHVVISAIEHDAILQTVESLVEQNLITATIVGCDKNGIVDPQEFANAIQPDTVLASLMLANNEVGTIQEVATTAQLIHRHNSQTLIHTDAVQALGKLPINPEDLGVDLLSLSAHKVYGPKGVGALWIRHGIFLGTQMTGGGQERNRRSGTENVAAIVGLGAAATLVESEREQIIPRLAKLSAQLIEDVKQISGAIVTADVTNKLPNFATFAFPDMETEVLLVALDEAGICASGGSACSSGATLPAHVLVAMGLAENYAALRCSLGRGTTEAGVEKAGQAITQVVNQIQASAPAPAGSD